MQSSEATPSPTQNQPTLQPLANKASVTLDAITAGLKDGDTPLAFLQNNIKPIPTTEVVVDPQKVANDIAIAKATTEQKTETGDYNYDLNPKPKAATPPSTAAPAGGNNPTEKPATAADGSTAKSPEVKSSDENIPGTSETNADDKKLSLADNLKRLNTKAKELEKTVSQKDLELQETQKKLKAYETGEVLPEVLQEKENKIAELAKYQKLHDLKASPEYEESFIKPIAQITAKLDEYAASYGIPKEVIGQALNKSNVAELNKFLAEHFDDVGALEVKQLVTNLKSIQGQAQEAEKEPAKVLDALRQQHREVQQVRDAQRKHAIASTARSAWTDSLLEVRSEGHMPELTMIDNDPEHNEKYVKPVLQAASTEFGKIVRMLGEQGLTHLSEDLAKALSKACIYSHASAIAVQTREAAVARLRELEAASVRTTRLSRPAIGGSSNFGGGGAPSAPAVSQTPTEAAQGILNSVLSK